VLEKEGALRGKLLVLVGIDKLEVPRRFRQHEYFMLGALDLVFGCTHREVAGHQVEAVVGRVELADPRAIELVKGHIVNECAFGREHIAFRPLLGIAQIHSHRQAAASREVEEAKNTCAQPVVRTKNTWVQPVKNVCAQPVMHTQNIQAIAVGIDSGFKGKQALPVHLGGVILVKGTVRFPAE
jgi:hypothetical protein